MCEMTNAQLCARSAQLWREYRREYRHHGNSEAARQLQGAMRLVADELHHRYFPWTRDRQEVS